MFNAPANADSDQQLANELKKYKNIIFPYQADFRGSADSVDYGDSDIQNRNEARVSKSVTTPIDLFKNVTEHGHINANTDSDGVVRKTFLQIMTPQEGLIHSLAVRAVEIAGHSVDAYLKKYPQEMTIRYSLKTSDPETVSFVDVMNGKVKLKDRIVLVGFTAQGFENDNGNTPIESNMKMVYVHANIINQLLQDTHITPEQDWQTIVLILVLGILMGIFAWRFRPTVSIIILFVIAIILVIAQFKLFDSPSGLYLNIVDPIAAMVLTYLVNISIKTYFETKQKNYITKQFGRYISPELVKEIAASDQEIKLGGISKELTVLFLDVRGFTPLSEKLQPEEVVGFLNMMFDLITERALENHGTIDKFIGDAAMILFNAPLDVQNHEYYAVKAAFDIQQGMKKVREDVQEKYGVTIAVGIGINTGQVVVGNIGSYLRVDYTAIGDNVNTAARIESNTQPNQVLVSEATYERTKDNFEYNYVGEKMMKGKSVGIKVYEVLNHVKAPN
jgi:adenylate cyclase